MLNFAGSMFFLPELVNQQEGLLIVPLNLSVA